MNLTWVQRTLASNVRALRQARGEEASGSRRHLFSLDALARELDISERAYSGLDNGKRPIDIDRMLILARYLDVSPLDLLTPAPEDDEALLQLRPPKGVPRTLDAVSVDQFVQWCRGLAPLPSQHKYRWVTVSGRRRSDIGFADHRFRDPQSRVEGRTLPNGDKQLGSEPSSEPLEIPERRQVNEALEAYWVACGSDDEDGVERALDRLFGGLTTGRRRLQGDPDPESPMWGGRRLPLLHEHSGEEAEEIDE